jgi:clan AA aspartic protease (TIGR02281 family)
MLTSKCIFLAVFFLTGTVAAVAQSQHNEPQESAPSLVPRGSERPSFDCLKAKTAVARLICADGELARLDGELGAAFRKRKAQIPATNQPKFVAGQVAWIRERNEHCALKGKDTEAIEVLADLKPCVASALRERIDILTTNGAVDVPPIQPQADHAVAGSPEGTAVGRVGSGPLEDEVRPGLRAWKSEDYATAMRLLRPLAESGNAIAQYFVGDMYDRGLGVEQSYVQAAIWYRKAAEQGERLAQTGLGFLYQYGNGVPKDYAEAMKWMLKAAKQGYWPAQMDMSYLYKKGWVVPQNYVLAYMWESLAGHNPHYEKSAKVTLSKELEPLMAPSEIAEAQDLAQQCIESHYENCPATRQRVTALPSPKLSQPSAKSSQATVPLKVSDGGTFLVPVEINGRITLDFTLDSGASDVTVPDDVFTTLKRTGTVKETDIIGQRTYVLADGSKSQSTTFTIRSLKVGDTIIENVTASVAPSQGALLLGQSFLRRFKSWSIDNASGGLLLEVR